MSEAEIEAQLVKCCSGGRFVWREIEDGVGSCVVTGDGDAVAG